MYYRPLPGLVFFGFAFLSHTKTANALGATHAVLEDKKDDEDSASKSIKLKAWTHTSHDGPESRVLDAETTMQPPASAVSKEQTTSTQAPTRVLEDEEDEEASCQQVIPTKGFDTHTHRQSHTCLEDESEANEDVAPWRNVNKEQKTFNKHGRTYRHDLPTKKRATSRPHRAIFFLLHRRLCHCFGGPSCACVGSAKSSVHGGCETCRAACALACAPAFFFGALHLTWPAQSAIGSECRRGGSRCHAGHD